MAVRIEPHAEPIPGYRLLGRLGGGGFGEVWKAEAPGGLLKAIKFVYGDLEQVDADGQRAGQELKALSRVKSVRHPYVLSLERFDIIDGQLIIVMELADKNLWDRFKECRGEGLTGIPRDEMLAYMEEIAEALDLMNGQYQLQHLDIKPQNLFVCSGHVKVADFGLVKDLEGMQASVTGGVTPVYAAPETFDGWVSRYSDQYSLAIVYQELLTGQRPFTGGNVRQLVLQHLQGTPNLNSLPPEDRPIIARALAKNPDDRHLTCKEMVQALRLAGSVGSGQAGALSAEDGVRRLLFEASAGVTTPPGVGPAPVAGPGTVTRPGVVVASTESLMRATRSLRPGNGGRDAAPETRNGERTPGPASTTVNTPPPAPPPPPLPPPPPEPVRPVVPEIQGDGVLFPTLVIGIGEMGLTVLQELRASLQQHLGRSADGLSQLRLLLLDTDPAVLRPTGGRSPGAAWGAMKGGAAAGSDREDLISAREIVLAPLNRPTHYLKARDGRPAVESWLSSKILYRIPRTRLTQGVRALGRLAFCDNYRGIVRRFRSELEAILDPASLEQAATQTGLGLRTNRPRVYVVAGLGGGTGSGMFLDVAYVIRRLLKEAGYEQPDVVGLLLVPPVGSADAPHGERGPEEKGQEGNGRPASLPLPEGNTFAALTELRHFATPGTTFQARYLDNEPPLKDSEPPFQRYFLLPLPKDEEALGTTASTAAEFLCRDLCSPLGRTLDQARTALTGPPAPERGLFYAAFGLYQWHSPQRLLVARAARLLCLRLVQRWMTKDATPIQAEVAAWAREQWEKEVWQPPVLRSHLEGSAQRILGAPFEEALTGLLEPLLKGRTPEGKGRSLPSLPAEPAVAAATLRQVEELVGQPPGEEVLGQVAVLPEAVREAAQSVVADWSQKVAELVVNLIEQPQFRLAGAEEAVRQITRLIEKVLTEQEASFKDQAAQAAETYKKLRHTVAGLARSSSSRSRTPPTGAELAELLRQYSRQRFQSLLSQQVVAVYVSLRGQLSDQLREINFCRVRLGELLRAFADGREVPPEPGSEGKEDTRSKLLERLRRAREESEERGARTEEKKTDESASPTSSTGLGCCLFPPGCRTIEEAVERCLGWLTREALRELDGQMQRVIRKQFTALVQVCLTSANVLPELETAMQQEAEAFFKAHQEEGGRRREDGDNSPHETDAAELFLLHHGTPEAARAEVARGLAAACPGVQTEFAQAAAPTQLVVLLTPEHEAGQRWRALTEETLEGVKPVAANGGEDLVLFREWPFLPLADLEQLGPAGEAAYRQLLALEHFTPHTRTDLVFESDQQAAGGQP